MYPKILTETGCFVDSSFCSDVLAMTATTSSDFVAIFWDLQNRVDIWFSTAPGSMSIRARTPAIVAGTMKRLFSDGSNGSMDFSGSMILHGFSGFNGSFVFCGSSVFFGFDGFSGFSGVNGSFVLSGFSGVFDSLGTREASKFICGSGFPSSSDGLLGSSLRCVLFRDSASIFLLSCTSRVLQVSTS